jgi:hypothetical protein
VPKFCLCVASDMLVGSVVINFNSHVNRVILGWLKELFLLDIVALCCQGGKVHTLMKVKLPGCEMCNS